MRNPCQIKDVYCSTQLMIIETGAHLARTLENSKYFVKPYPGGPTSVHGDSSFEKSLG